MHRRHQLWAAWVGVANLLALSAPVMVHAAVPNSLILNEANTITGDKYLDATKNPTRVDAALGRVQGNGQNWLEFMVVQGDEAGGGAFKNTLDLRGWKLDWSYDKQDPTSPNNFGNGEMTFSNDPAWAAVPRGAILTISEWQDAWYSKTPDPTDTSTGTPAGTPRNGLPRVGGINGLGNVAGAPYDPINDVYVGASLPGAPAHPKPLYTDFSWNPQAGGGGANGDWHMNVWAGERNPDNSFKYFNFSGSVTKDGVTSQIGTQDGGLFVVNNDNWQISIHDNSAANGGAGNVIEGPIGEQIGGFGVSSVEIEHFENGLFAAPNVPTQADYLNAGIGDYQDGSSSTFGQPSIWSSGAHTQDVSALRNWVEVGDANLDGHVDAADYTIWRAHLGQSGDFRSGDFDGNGLVEMADYNLWRSNFGLANPGAGAGASSSTAVPEPTSLVLSALGALLFSAMRRRY